MSTQTGLDDTQACRRTRLEIPESDLERADRLCGTAVPGVKLTRPQTLRVALAKGLDLLERTKR